MTRPIYQVKADFFKTLGHPARIRILELLRDGECLVGDLIPAVGIEPSHLSQQLGVLRRANILQVRREGAAVRYSVADPRIFELLEVAKAILTSSLSGSSQLLAELQGLEFGGPPDSPGKRAGG
ncbi:MAG: ArsR/SmtB family transcription factor [Streptosporangiaceae bacterium]